MRFGVGWSSDEVVPRLVHLVLAREPFRSLRGRCRVDARGRLLEPSSGSGLNLSRYGPAVREVPALEPGA